MHLGIFAKTFPRPTLEETLDAVAEHGLYHVQFNLACTGLPTLPERLDENLCIWIARAFRERGLTMAAISGTFNLCDPDGSRLVENLRRLEVLAAACRWLDTRIITLCTGTLDPEDMWRWHPGNVRRTSWDTLIASMRQAIEIADRHEVTLAFEPEIHNVVNSVSKARRLLDEIGSPWLKVVIDPANLIRPGEASRAKEILDEAFDWLGPDIVLAHGKSPAVERAAGAAAEQPSGPPDFWAGFADFSSWWMRKQMAREQTSEQAEALLSDFFSLSMRVRPEQDPTAVPPSELALLFAFYFTYFQWLKKIGYGGSVVIHGIPEGEVGPVALFLTQMLLWLDRGS
jgi:sugar phosphate isomerase/epimerase